MVGRTNFTIFSFEVSFCCFACCCCAFIFVCSVHSLLATLTRTKSGRPIRKESRNITWLGKSTLKTGNERKEAFKFGERTKSDFAEPLLHGSSLDSTTESFTRSQHLSEKPSYYMADQVNSKLKSMGFGKKTSIEFTKALPHSISVDSEIISSLTDGRGNVYNRSRALSCARFSSNLSLAVRQI